jgi:hypothetical protein
MGKKKKKKSYVMTTEEAKKKLKQLLKEIEEDYNEITKAEETINDRIEGLGKKEKEAFKIYHANKDRLSKRILSKNSLISIRCGLGTVKTSKGFAEKIIGILEDLHKELLIRRILSITFKASREKIEKICTLIEEMFKKERIKGYTIEAKSELNKDKIKENPKSIKNVSQLKIERKNIFSIKSAGFKLISLKKVPKELRKEF